MDNLEKEIINEMLEKFDPANSEESHHDGAPSNGEVFGVIYLRESYAEQRRQLTRQIQDRTTFIPF